METRKIQRTGHSTFTVSLPKDWIVNGGINKGERMLLSLRKDGTIVLNVPGKVRIPKEYTISGPINEAALFRKVLGLYLAGFHTINFIFTADEGMKLRTELRRILSKITGLEVMDESSTHITVKDLFDTSKYPPARVLERMHNLTGEMLRTAISDLKGSPSKHDSKDYIIREVQWLNWLMARQYNMVLYDSSSSDILGITCSDGLNYVNVCKSLERISSHAMRISNSTHDSRIELEVSDRILEQLNMSIQSFKTKDRENARGVVIASMGMKWIDQDKDMMGDVIVRATVADSMNRIITYINEIAETAYYASFIPDSDR